MVGMEKVDIDYVNFDSKVILLFLFCRDSKLDVRKVLNLYSQFRDEFWKILLVLFPAFKMTPKKFERLSKISLKILSKLKFNNKVELSKSEIPYFTFVNFFIPKLFECEGKVYLINNLQKFLSERDYQFKLILKNNILQNATLRDFAELKNEISCMVIYDKEGRETYFKRTSYYNYILNQNMYDSNENKEDAHLKTMEYLMELISNNETQE